MQLDAVKLAEQIATIAQFAIATSNTGRDNQVAQIVSDAVAQIDWNQKPEPDEVVAAMFDVLALVADKTPTKVDDKVLRFAESIINIYGLDQQAPSLIDRIKTRIRQRRAKKSK